MNIQLQAQAKAASQLASALLHSGHLQRKYASGQYTSSESEIMQRAAVNSAQIAHTNTVPPIVHDVLNSPGQQLDAETRAFMEPRFGHDFSNVRVHTDTTAAESARSVNALAYTVGQHVAFDQGRYRPNTLAGKQLLAHELTHVMQQGTSIPTSNTLTISSPHDASEQIAHRMASEVVAEKSPLAMPGVSHAVSSTLYRQETPVATPAPSSTSPAPASQAQTMSVTLDHFGFGEDKLPKDQANELKALDALAKTIVSVLSTQPDALVTVVGHTDEVGTDKYNLDLGKRRAEAVRDYLVQNNIPINRIRVHSFGKSVPVVKTGKASELNRRVEVLFDVATAQSNKSQANTPGENKANKSQVRIPLPPTRGDVDVKVQEKPRPKQEEMKPSDRPETKSPEKKEETQPVSPKKEGEEEKPHLGKQIGIGVQVLAKLVQLSITEDLDLSAVFGGTYNDVFGQPKANKGAVVFGGEAELKLKKPVSIVVDVLGAYPFAPPDDTPTLGSKRVPMMLSAELRLSW